eukprot:186172_1
MAFMVYLGFNAVLCISIMVMEYINYNRVLDLPSISSLLFATFPFPNGTLRYVLIYSVMILALWESLFAFSRYYSTYQVAIKVRLHVSTRSMLKKFSIYVFIFTLTYAAHVHFEYWFCIILILFHAIFNLYCNWKFIAILVEQYKFFQCQQNSDITGSDQMLRNLYLLRKVLLMCGVIHSLSFSIFIVIHHVNTIYFLPILWCIAAALSCISFARNRLYISGKCACCQKEQKELKCTLKNNTSNKQWRSAGDVHTLQDECEGSDEDGIIDLPLSRIAPFRLTKSENNVLTETDATSVSLPQAPPTIETSKSSSKSCSKLRIKINGLDVPMIEGKETMKLDEKYVNPTLDHMDSYRAAEKELDKIMKECVFDEEDTKKDKLAVPGSSPLTLGLQTASDPRYVRRSSGRNKARNEDDDIESRMRSLRFLKSYGLCTQSDVDGAELLKTRYKLSKSTSQQ